MANIRIEVGNSSDKGKVRSSNEDTVMNSELSIETDTGKKFAGLYVVADGLGGLEDGEIASQIAVKTLSEIIAGSQILLELNLMLDSMNREVLQNLLANAVQAANREVFELSQKEQKRVGTTLTALLLVDSSAVIANVGDSRIYLLREGTLKQITVDHSLVTDLVSAGELKQDEIYTYPYRNIITRCLGMEPEIEIDLCSREVKPGDIFLLCSDGLWEMIRDDQIQKVLETTENPQKKCEDLVEIANQNGGADNISVIVFKVEDAGKTE